MSKRAVFIGASAGAMAFGPAASEASGGPTCECRVSSTRGTAVEELGHRLGVCPHCGRRLSERAQARWRAARWWEEIQEAAVGMQITSGQVYGVKKTTFNSDSFATVVCDTREEEK